MLNNLYNNLDNMPNLIDFKLYCDLRKDNEAIYKRFIKKILSMKYIKNIDIIFLRENIFEYYSKKELQKIFQDIIFDKYNEITIRKIKLGLSDKCINF